MFIINIIIIGSDILSLRFDVISEIWVWNFIVLNIIYII